MRGTTILKKFQFQFHTFCRFSLELAMSQQRIDAFLQFWQTSH